MCVYVVMGKVRSGRGAGGDGLSVAVCRGWLLKVGLVRWVAALVGLSVLVAGCGQSSGGAANVGQVQESGTLPTGIQDSEPGPTVEPNGVGSAQGSSGDPGMSGFDVVPERSPNPGDEPWPDPVPAPVTVPTPEVTSVPDVSQTSDPASRLADAIGGTGSGAAVVELRGGLWMLPELESGPWPVSELFVVDLCDDSLALVVSTGRVLGPDDEVTAEDRLEIEAFRSSDGVICDEAGGNRYAYVDVYGRWPAQPTEHDAAAQFEIWWAQGGYVRSTDDGESLELTNWASAYLMGHYDTMKPHRGPSVEPPAEVQDQVVVLADTVTVREGVVRGLVQNLSWTSYARDVIVTARAASEAGDAEMVEEGSWWWPLTVQPGERAPFEIDGWAGGFDPEMVELEVNASLSARVDLKRSFAIDLSQWSPRAPKTADDYLRTVPDFARQDLPEPLPDTDYFDFEELVGWMFVADSHPAFRSQYAELAIEDPRAYFALLDGDAKVVDVVESVTYASFDTGHMRIDRLPAKYENPVSGDRIPVISIRAGVLDPGPQWLAWIGGANPPPERQPGE